MTAQSPMPGAEAAPGAPTLGGRGVGAGEPVPGAAASSPEVIALRQELIESCGYLVEQIRYTVLAAGSENSVTVEAFETFKYIMFGDGMPHPFVLKLVDEQRLESYAETFNEQKAESVRRVIDACKRSYGMKFIDFGRDHLAAALPHWRRIVAWAEDDDDDKLSWAAMELEYLVNDVQNDTVEEALQYRYSMDLKELDVHFRAFGSIMATIAAALDEGYFANVLLNEIVKHLRQLDVETDADELLIKFSR